MSDFIPYGRQQISEEDIQAVVAALRSDFIAQGPRVPQFERAVCDFVGAGHGVAVNSGASALHLACRALGLGRGDWLWSTPITFAASTNCALHCGAQVDFVDIDPADWNLSVAALQEKLEWAERVGRLPKIVIPVHLCGFPCAMEAIHALSKRYGFHLIEDACHAIGGRYQNGPVGNCRYSDITVFSFHPVKNMTTGEGGMAVTNDEELAATMALLRSHGITRDRRRMAPAPPELDGPWRYEQIDLGYNYRMTDLQAALGLSQLQRLESFIEARARLAKRYDRQLEDLPVQLQRPSDPSDGRRSALHLYVIRLALDELSITRAEAFDALRGAGIGVNLHYIPLYAHPYYQKMGFKNADYPQAERYFREAITLPLFPALREEQVDRIVARLKEILR